MSPFIRTPLFLIFILLLRPVTLLADMYKWVDEQGVTHYSDVGVPENESDEAENIGSSDSSKISENCVKIGISLFDVRGDWSYADKSIEPIKGERIYPRLLFSVKNLLDKKIVSQNFKALFLEPTGDDIYGRGFSKTDDLPPGYTSSTIFIKSNMGYIFNGNTG